MVAQPGGAARHDRPEPLDPPRHLRPFVVHARRAARGAEGRRHARTHRRARRAPRYLRPGRPVGTLTEPLDQPAGASAATMRSRASGSVTTSRPSRVTSQSWLRTCSSSFVVVAVEVHNDTIRAEHVDAQAHDVDRAQLRVGHEHDERGLRARPRARPCRRRPRAASARRRRSRRARSRRAACCCAISVARSATVNGSAPERRPRPSAAPSPAGSQRWAGHTACGSSPVASPSTSASVGHVVLGCERLHGLARDHRDAACAAARSPAAAVTHVLPMSVPVPVTTTKVIAAHRDGSSARREASPNTSTSAATRRSTWASVCAALSATRSREVPGATVGGRIAGTTSPCSRSAAAASIAALLSPHTNGRIGDG